MRQAGLVLRVIAIFSVSVLGISRIAVADDAQKGEPGGAVTVGATATATVKAIDADKRIVTLQKENGDTVDVPCGEQVRNFDQIKVGDQVKAAAIARIAVSIGKGGSPNAEAGTYVARAPQGAKPGAIIAKTEDVTAKVDAVDPAKQTVTLSGIDDKPQTIEVAADVDLSSVKPGDAVTVRLTKGIATRWNRDRGRVRERDR
jgi:Cu/Ag efflux protein CusF